MQTKTDLIRKQIFVYIGRGEMIIYHPLITIKLSNLFTLKSFFSLSSQEKKNLQLYSIHTSLKMLNILSCRFLLQHARTETSIDTKKYRKKVKLLVKKRSEICFQISVQRRHLLISYEDDLKGWVSKKPRYRDTSYLKNENNITNIVFLSFPPHPNKENRYIISFLLPTLFFSIFIFLYCEKIYYFLSFLHL